MNVLILAAGYGTRLARGIDEDTSGNYAHLKGLPKGLLPIGPKALIAHWIDDLIVQPCVAQICIISNDHFYPQFAEWHHANCSDKEKVLLLNDGTKSNETRLGAIGSIQFALDQIKGLREKPLLVIGGDTLFFDDFDLANFHAKSSDYDAFVTTYTIGDDETTKYGIIETVDNKISGFLEKPANTETNSRSACPCFYFFRPSVFAKIDDFLRQKSDRPLKERDATGLLLAFLYPNTAIGTFAISGRYDVGNLTQYIECAQAFN